MEIRCNCLNFKANIASNIDDQPNSNNNNDNITKTTPDFFAKSIYVDLLRQYFKNPELICEFTVKGSDGLEWQLVFCVNCKIILYATQVRNGPGGRCLIDSQIVKSPEAWELLRKHKSYSEAFEVIITDDADGTPGNGATPPTAAPTASPTNVAAVATSVNVVTSGQGQGQGQGHVPLDGQGQRLLQLQASVQAKIQNEIEKTNKLIESYTQQQFRLLQCYTEKAKQDAALLERRIQQLPEQLMNVVNLKPTLELTRVFNYHNSSRRNLGVPTTPTTPLLQPPNCLPLQQDVPQQQQQQQPLPSATILTARKMSNFDTPPATPEATPMSVGNSPTFRQQQQQQQQQASANFMPLMSLPSAAGNAAASVADDGDCDCLFDLEDVDGTTQTSPFYQQQQQQQQYQHQRQQFQRLQQPQLILRQQDNMSDADEAEDALDLDNSLPIPMHGAAGGAQGASAQMNYANFARSLPVDIANSPMAARAININNNNQHVHTEGEEVLDNNLDIAASIKALAKSVHGEAVFGDLPRPRLPSQI